MMFTKHLIEFINDGVKQIKNIGYELTDFFAFVIAVCGVPIMICLDILLMPFELLFWLLVRCTK